MSDFSALLAAEFAPYHALSAKQLAEVEYHFALLTRWNKSLNLTRITNLPDVVRLHYGESLLLGHYLPLGTLRIVDIGSGAGFPGLPVAILRPECQVDLVESHRRKSVFLAEASRDLPNIRVLAQRAEQCAPVYDWMISRAVRPADVLALRLAPNAALLMSADEASNFEGRVIRLPWGKNRVLLMMDVPRGTHSPEGST